MLDLLGVGSTDFSGGLVVFFLLPDAGGIGLASDSDDNKPSRGSSLSLKSSKKSSNDLLFVGGGLRLLFKIEPVDGLESTVLACSFSLCPNETDFL